MGTVTAVERLVYRNGGSYYELSGDYHKRYFDARLYHNLGLTTNKAKNLGSSLKTEESNSDYNYVNKGRPFLSIYPYASYRNYSGDYYETPEAILERIADIDADLENTEDVSTVSDLQQHKKALKERMELIMAFNKHFEDSSNMLAPHSLIHPYAIVKFAGASGHVKLVEGSFLFDHFATRKWYEIDGDNLSSYAKTPTTTKLIAWGNEDPQGRVPYAYQDFVFCKNWNVIPNNRMITLRRYFAPVTDNIEFDAYKETEKEEPNPADPLYTKDPKEKVKGISFAPLATAITYFGEGTGNDLSNILSFSARYKWKELEAQASPIDIDAQANDMGNGLTNPNMGILSGAMKAMSIMTGFQNAMNGRFNPMNAASNAVPPDPYSNGPYENRILGPINVIMNTMQRERGLEFKQENLKLTFSYIARPIAGINNKAVLLDLLSNILVLCYANGTWFGGLERFRSENRTAYPFTSGKVMNKLYRGQLFGKGGAVRTAATQAWNENVIGGLGEILSEALKDMKNIVSGLWNELMSSVHALTGNTEKSDAEKKQAQENFKAGLGGKAMKGFQNVMAAKILRGAQIPWIHNKKALLTGEPVGDWHLTIGNPLNPIAMIGNLVCDGVEIKWSDELGPDDFPIGFDAVINLKHGLGRDREAIESMFNRGYGRIYSLPNEFRSSADWETKVDNYTGGAAAQGPQGRMKYEEWSGTYVGGGGAWLGNMENHEMFNNGANYNGLRGYKSLIPIAGGEMDNRRSASEIGAVQNAVYKLTPFQMKWAL
jgi:hypothetical protein